MKLVHRNRIKNSVNFIGVMFKNIIFDRDGIINEVVYRDDVISSPWEWHEFKILKQSINFLNHVSASNKKIFIATNQPDISRGNLLEKNLIKMHNAIQDAYRIDKIYYCPHDNQHNCNCRKPKPGMLLNIINDHELLKEETCMIGDSQKDIEAANAAGIESFLYLTEYNKDKHTSKNIFQTFDELISFF